MRWWWFRLSFRNTNISQLYLVKCCRVCKSWITFRFHLKWEGKKSNSVRWCWSVAIIREIKPTNQGRHGQRRCHVEICVHAVYSAIRVSWSSEALRWWRWCGKKWHFWLRLVFSMKEIWLKQKQLFTIKCHKMRLAKVLAMSMTSVTFLGLQFCILAGEHISTWHPSCLVRQAASGPRIVWRGPCIRTAP